MNEDDTYNALVRTPASVLNSIIARLPVDTWNMYANDSELRELFLLSHGWTYAEWLIKLNVRIV